MSGSFVSGWHFFDSELEILNALKMRLIKFFAIGFGYLILSLFSWFFALATVVTRLEPILHCLPEEFNCSADLDGNPIGVCGTPCEASNSAVFYLVAISIVVFILCLTVFAHYFVLRKFKSKPQEGR